MNTCKTAKKPPVFARAIVPWLAALCLVLLAVSVVACSKGQGSAPLPTSDRAESSTRSVVITVHALLSVDEITPATSSFRKLVAKYDGIVASATISGADNRMAHFEAKIPAGRLDAFRSDVRGLGEMESESEKVEDVTAPHADLEARLRNAKAHEQRLLKLLEEKTGSLADIVAIEKALTSAREKIERFEAEKRVRTVASPTQPLTFHYNPPIPPCGLSLGTPSSAPLKPACAVLATWPSEA